MNYVEHIDRVFATLSADDISERKALPRPEPNGIALEERPKSPWCFEKSIFAPYKYDTDELLARCFYFDWKCSKIEKMIKSVKDKEKMFSEAKASYLEGVLI